MSAYLQVADLTALSCTGWQSKQSVLLSSFIVPYKQHKIAHTFCTRNTSYNVKAWNTEKHDSDTAKIQKY